MLFDPYRMEPIGGSSGSFYPDWLGEHFTPAEIASGTLTSRESDPDRDGCSNYHEYVFATNPRLPDAAVVPISKIGFHVTIEYWRQRTGVVYQTEISWDLRQWSPLEPDDVLVLESDENRERVRATMPSSEDSHHYVRIVASD